MKRFLYLLLFVAPIMAFGCRSTVDGLQKDVRSILSKMEIEDITTKKPPEKKGEVLYSGVKTGPAGESPPEQPEELKYSLTVHPVPEDSSVKIINIQPRYTPGIRLSPGIYDLMVEREGYETHREWIVVDADTVLTIPLNKGKTVALAEKNAPEKVIAPKQSKPASDATAAEESKGDEKAALPEEKAVLEKIQFPTAFSGHSDSVTSLCFSPDGGVLASGSYDGFIFTWDMTDGHISHKLNHGAGVKTICFSPDGRLLASSGNDKTVKLWDLSEAKLKNTFRGHTRRAHSLAFSPGADSLICGGENELIFWETATGRIINFAMGDDNLYPRFETIRDIAVRSTGNSGSDYMVAFSCERGINLFYPATKKMFTIPDRTPAGSVTFSPDGQYVVWGARHQYNESLYFPRFAPVEAQKIDGELTQDDDLASADRVFFTAYTPDGRKLVMLSYKQAVLYDISTAAVVRMFSGTSETSATDAAISPDGNTLAATSGSLIRLWKLSE